MKAMGARPRCVRVPRRVGDACRVGRAVAARHRQAAELAAERGITRWHLSLTHTDLVAIAYVVAE